MSKSILNPQQAKAISCAFQHVAFLDHQSTLIFTAGNEVVTLLVNERVKIMKHIQGVLYMEENYKDMATFSRFYGATTL